MFGSRALALAPAPPAVALDWRLAMAAHPDIGATIPGDIAPHRLMLVEQAGKRIEKGHGQDCPGERLRRPANALRPDGALRFFG